MICYPYLNAQHPYAEQGQYALTAVKKVPYRNMTLINMSNMQVND